MTKNQHAAWYVYIIRTQADTYYTGITNNVGQRWQDHEKSKRGAKFFRTSKPAALVYVEKVLNRSHASRREAVIKQLRRREKITLIHYQAPVGLP